MSLGLSGGNTAKPAPPTPATPATPSTPTLTPSGFLLLARRSPIPDPRSRLRPAQPRPGWLLRGETPSGAMHADRDRIRGFRGTPECPETGFSGPWCRFRMRCGVLVFPPSRSWHHGPLLGSRESFLSTSGPSGPVSPSGPIAHPYRLPGPPSLSPIPAALPPVNPAEKPLFPLSCSPPARSPLAVIRSPPATPCGTPWLSAAFSSCEGTLPPLFPSPDWGRFMRSPPVVPPIFFFQGRVYRGEEGAVSLDN